jgi:hypothetical protein
MALTRDWYPFTRRSLAEPKNLRASAPIMPNPAFAVLRCSRDVLDQVAYQLTVTHRGKRPDPGFVRLMSGNRAIQGSTAKTAAK